MSLFVIVIHIIVCIALIMIVLLQTGKGADMGAAFGGGSSNTLFGATGASSFLSKMTTVAAVVFMLTSLVLAYMATNRTGSSVLSDQPAVQQSTTETETTPPAGEATSGAETTNPPAETTSGAETTDPAPASQQQEETPKNTDE
jgi:preprotein translocase subunit SecG